MAFDAAAADAGYVVSAGRWSLADEDLPYLRLAYSLIVSPQGSTDADVHAMRAHLWRFGWHRGAIAALYRESQRLGDFSDLNSAAVISGVLDAIRARVGSRTLSTDPTDVEYADLFYLNLLIDWLWATDQGRLGIPKWIHWRRILGAGTACVEEIWHRLDEHHHGARVLGTNAGNKNALNELLIAAASKWRRAGNNTLLPSSIQDELIDSQSTALWTVIAETTANHASPFFEFLPPELQHLEMLRLAMDGKYDHVPGTVVRRTIDDQRAALTEMRGKGVIPESLTRLPRPNSDATELDRQEYEECRKMYRRGHNPELPAVLSDFARQSTGHPQIARDLGPARRTWWLYQRSYERSKQSPDELGPDAASEPFDPIEATQKEIAAHLGVSPTKIRDDTARIRSVIRKYAASDADER
jgi:hypothetical protein